MGTMLTEVRMAYEGAERRIHRVFITHNTEYHLRRDRCVAVRDRRSGHWYSQHAALHRRVAGALAFMGGGSLRVREEFPKVGECLCFDGIELVTSEVLNIARPDRDAVSVYDA